MSCEQRTDNKEKEDWGFATNAVLVQYKETQKLTAHTKAYGGYGRVPGATVAYRRSCRLYKCKYQRLR